MYICICVKGLADHSGQPLPENTAVQEVKTKRRTIETKRTFLDISVK